MKFHITICVMILAWQRQAWAEDMPNVFQKVRLEQRVGQIIPSGLKFFNEQGSEITLGSLMDQRPVILLLAYYTCPNLCPMLQRHLTEGLNGIGLKAGRDFDVIVASIDPDDTIESALRQKQITLGGYRHRNATNGWHYLTGKATDIANLEQAIGFSCVPDPHRKQFAHPLGAIVICPGGKISHYFFGVDFSPADLEAALKDAAAGKTSVASNTDWQYCMDYSPSTTRYGRIAVHGLQCSAIAWVLLIVAYIGRELRRGWRRKQTAIPRVPCSRPPPNSSESTRTIPAGVSMPWHTENASHKEAQP